MNDLVVVKLCIQATLSEHQLTRFANTSKTNHVWNWKEEITLQLKVCFQLLLRDMKCKY